MTKTQPLISVVMPSFNQVNFIDAAIGSIWEQDYEQWEVLVIDGGSTDGTVQRLEAWSLMLGSRLRWVSEKDSGPANAINKALDLASGEVIGWLNSDDIYAPGAVSAAARHFLANPDAMMVYGEAEHIDEEGGSLGRYPTQPPSATIQSFQDGCFICQPTVFLRRKVFDDVGYLDETLVTAFDFELWLRIFRRFPDNINQIERVQAYSRLHAECITHKLRRFVAIEGISILAKHVGQPKPHWILTYLDELYVTYPFEGDIASLETHVAQLFEQIKHCFDEDTLNELACKVFKDARLQIALPGVFATVYSDGWAPPNLEIRIKKLPESSSAITLQCDHLTLAFRPLSLRITTSWGWECRVIVKKPGEFEIMIDLLGIPTKDNLVISIESETNFIPRNLDPASSDSRQLSFKVYKLQLESTGSRLDDRLQNNGAI